MSDKKMAILVPRRNGKIHVDSATAYFRAYQHGRAEERAAIVEWLRSEEDRIPGWSDRAGLLDGMAEAIEAGEHMPKEPSDG